MIQREVFESVPENLQPENHSSPPARFYHPELDVLRFFAFALVFVAHAFQRMSPNDLYSRIGLAPVYMRPISGVIHRGGFGVDLFFVLSAFLITELLLRERRRRGTIDVRSFWIRRILRIWPLYFAFLTFAIIVVPPLLGQMIPFWHRIAFFTFVGNYVLAARPEVSQVVSILWSVSVEEQFYLLWPLVVFFFFKRLRLIAAGLWIFSFTVRTLLILGGTGFLPIWYNTFTRMDPIACGMLLALWLDGRIPSLSQWQRAIGITIGFLIFSYIGNFVYMDGKSAVLAYPLGTIASALLLISFYRGGHVAVDS